MTKNWYEVLEDFWDFITEEGGKPGESEWYLDSTLEEKYDSMDQLIEAFRAEQKRQEDERRSKKEL